MSKTIYEVQQGEAEYTWESHNQERILTGMCWSFDRAFTMEHDAITYANLTAEDHEFVRVIDREV